MDAPLAKAAKRGWLFIAVPITVACPSAMPSDFTYCLTSGARTEAEPASASPKPSSIDFRPRSRTSLGMSSYFVLTIKSDTYFVRSGALGKTSAGAAGDGAGAGNARPGWPVRAVKAKDDFTKSRRNIPVDPPLSRRPSRAHAHAKRFVG